MAGRGQNGRVKRKGGRDIVKSIALSLVLLACLGLSGATSTAAPSPTNSILIENALLVDGSGAAPRVADVRVVGERIAAMGALDRAAGDIVIDARGLTLAPGFIDTHSHHGSGLAEQPE